MLVEIGALDVDVRECIDGGVGHKTVRNGS